MVVLPVFICGDFTGRAKVTAGSVSLRVLSGEIGKLGKTDSDRIRHKIEKNLTTERPIFPKLMLTTGPVPGRRALPGVSPFLEGKSEARVFTIGGESTGAGSPARLPFPQSMRRAESGWTDAEDRRRVTMRRFFVGVALFTLAAVTPLAAWGGDREIAEQIYAKLQGQQSAGVLQGFDLGLDVKEGRVLLNGHVSSEEQKQAVLAVANGVEGVSEVVDQIRVMSEKSTAAAKPTPVKVDVATGSVATTGSNSGFSLDKALIEQSPLVKAGQRPVDGMVRPAGSTEPVGQTSDESLRSTVMGSLSAAQKAGQLRGFGVQVVAKDGDVLLRGRARSSEVKSQIMEVVRRVPGVNNVIDDIAVQAAPQTAVQPTTVAREESYRNLQPVEVQTVANRVVMQDGGSVASAIPMAPEGPYYGGEMAPAPAYPEGGYGVSGYAGTPMPMAPIPQAYGAPMYESPNLPNYAWPGYAAYPNYAALTYPQQYSPTAWPYIGPFYPYPQVPLGWRKVSLEWDDGWWFLDFTDK